ncbi:hypothetical protein IFR05_008632 [Cadophora sp. M221]|nr:hypothetical protein IFR05_008632 [Cadophora sp. M221]
MKLIAGLLLGATLGAAAPQSLPRLAPESFNRRALPQCHNDNLYRIFIDTRYASSASAFCSTYITFTSISTIIPKATVTLTARVTDAISFITNVVVASKTNIIPGANPTITLTPKARRDRDEHLNKCPGQAGTYAPSLISSACSCLVTPVSVVSRTVTASSLTVTEKNILHVTKPTTTIVSTTTTVVGAHGGRALDTAPPAVHTLLEIWKYCPEVFSRIEVWVDGGIKKGTDVVKALCLGAKAVGVGRAVLFGLGAGGTQGIKRTFEILEAETETCMRLLGVEKISDLGPKNNM